jgi:hypothetical protein
MNDEQVEATAQKLADRGQEALVARLREAFKAAADKHRDLVTLDDDRLEELVQRSAERADGIQWRRALADLACDELGIGLVEALGHPAVARAQELVGAPSYEESLAELARRPVPEGSPAAEGPARTEEPGEEPEPDAEEPAAAEEELEPDAEEPPGGSEPEDDRLDLTALHLGGVANLPNSEEPLDLRLSGDGLDILQGEDEILGRLGWSEIDALDVPAPRRRRRRPGGTLLVVRTPKGDASFEVRELSSEELRARLEPLLARFGRSAT